MNPRSCLMRSVYFLLLCSLSVLSFAVADGQSATATLTGEVLDQNRAVVPQANVTITNDLTGQARHATTDGGGNFTIPLLPPGAYSVNVQHEGFAPVRITRVILNVGDQRAISIELKAGDVNATVQVTNEAGLVTTDPAVGTVVDRQFAANIPLNGRSFQSLVQLTPGVVFVPSGSPNTGGQFSVNGQRASANAFTVDGVSANFGAQPASVGGQNTSGNLPGFTVFGTTQSLVAVDALEEFKVQTSTYAAEYGRQPGGQISIVTRTGTNQFHGSAFDYLRNDVFDANDWFANANQQRRPPERQNDFGATLSGPILLPRFGEGGSQPGYNGRNRSFFFFSYEGLRLRLPLFSLTNVPSLALRQQAPLAVQPILNSFPLSNGRVLANGNAEFSASYSDPSTLNATSIRIDHIFNSKFTVFGRYNYAPSETVSRQADINLSNLQSQRLETQTLTLGATASLTPSINNEFRFNYSSNGALTSVFTDSFGGAVPLARSVLIPSAFDVGPSGATAFLRFPGRTSASNPGVTITGDVVTSQRQLNLINNFSYIRGSHQLKFGADFRRLTPIASVNSYFLTTFFLNQQQVIAATAGLGQLRGGLDLFPVFYNFTAYGQDSWKVSRRLTLDFGIRWDVNPAPHEANDNDAAAVTQITDLAKMDLAPLGTPEWQTTYRNFAPRFGASYQVSQASGREIVLRGGFGVFYDTGNDSGAMNYNQKFPYFWNRGTFANVTYPLSPSQVSPLPLPIQSGFVPPFSISVFDPRLRLPYTLQWNLALERSLGRNQTVTLSYVGAAGRRLLQQTQLSLGGINPKFSTVQLVRNSASSDYDALQAQFRRRLSRGLQVLTSYTWSHALDNDSISNNFVVALRGNADFDIRHVFSSAITYDLPTPRNDRMLDAVFGNWSLDSSVRVQSALPVDLNATFIVNPVDGSTINVRPDVITGVPLYVKDSTVPGGRKINGSALRVPAVGQAGGLGRNRLRGFGGWQIDAALRRQFSVTEKIKLQFRAEAFNLLNHPNFGTIQTTLSATNFGQATNLLNRQLGGISQLYQIGGPRSFQFALKVSY